MEQSPDLKEVTFNFTSSNRANSLPSFLAMEEDKLLFQSPDPFDEPGGLYSEEEVEGTEEAFLREWSICRLPLVEHLILRNPQPGLFVSQDKLNGLEE